MTVRSKIKNEITGKEKTATLVLDSGAECSFITDELADSLGLKREKGPSMKLTGFSGKAVETSPDEVTATLRTKEGDKGLKMRTIKKISKPFVPYQPTYEEEKEMKERGITLSTGHQKVKPDILVGNDLFVELLGEHPEVTHLKSGSKMLYTVLGWVRSGRKQHAKEARVNFMKIEQDIIPEKRQVTERIAKKSVTEDKPEIKRKLESTWKKGKKGETEEVQKTALPNREAQSKLTLKTDEEDSEAELRKKKILNRGTRRAFPNPKVTFMIITVLLSNIAVAEKNVKSSLEKMNPEVTELKERTAQFAAVPEMVCVPGGVRLTIGKPPEKYVVCTGRRCVAVTDPKEIELLEFEPEESRHTQIVRWHHDMNDAQKIVQTTCSARDACFTNTCTMCWEVLTNPECNPKLAMVIAMAIIYVIILLLKGVCRAFRWIGRNAWRFTRRADVEEIRVRRGDWINQRFRIALMALMLLTGEVMSQYCDSTIAIEAKEHACLRRGKQLRCYLETMQIVKFTPVKGTACLQVKAANETIGEFRIRLQNVVLECEKMTMYHTRNSEAKVMSVKRCPGMGSCTGNTCAETRTNSKIKELEKVASFPGNTRCTESCSGPFCLCGGLSAACIFYKEYFRAITREVYEVSRCSKWKPEVILDMEFINQDGKIEKETLKTGPSRAEKAMKGLGNLSITDINPYVLPILDSKFVTVVMGGPKRAFYMEEAWEPLLKCPTIGDTISHNNCVANTHCDCLPAETAMNCVCTPNAMSKWESKENRLPVTQGGAILSFTGTRILASTREATVELVIQLDGRLTSASKIVQAEKCQAAMQSLKGCYSCQEAAQAEISCQASDQTLGTLRCKDRDYTIKCSSNTETTKIKISAEKAEYNETCIFTCGLGSQHVEISGQLKYNRTRVDAEMRNPEQEKAEVEGGLLPEAIKNFKWPDFLHVLNVLMEAKWMMMIGAAVLCLLLCGSTKCAIRAVKRAVMLTYGIPTRFIMRIVQSMH